MAVPLTRTRPITSKEVRGLFAKAFLTKTRKALWPTFCGTIDTFTKTEYFATLGTVPQIEEQDEDVESDIKDFREYTYSFENKFFSATVALKRSLIWFDQIGQTKTILSSMAARAANFPDSRFITRLRNGTATRCITGSYFFANDHALGGTAPSTQSNLITGHTPTSDFDGISVLRPALAERLQADFDLAYTQLITWQDDNGQPFYEEIDANDLVLLCGPKLWTTFQIAFGADFINQTKNMFGGRVGRIATSNYLPATGAEAADWYLAHTGLEVKPMLYSRFIMRPVEMQQDKLGGEELEDAKRLASVEVLTNIGNSNDSDVIRNKEYLITANWLGEVVPGVPWTIVKVDNAAS